MTSSTDEKWRKIVEIHNSTKALYLLSEEITTELFAFYQPINELRNAEEHIVRSKSAELGMSSHGNAEETKNYIEGALDSALGHEYRAFFDTCDWLAMELRGQIDSDLDGYSRETINSVLPDYYPKTRLRIEEISQKIATLRGEKDIDKTGVIVNGVKSYEDIIKELHEIRKNINSNVSRFEEYVKNVKKIEAATIIKNKINEDLKEYGPETINAVLPDYYSKTSPKIEEICKKISGIKENPNIIEIEEYEKLITELGAIRDEISLRVPVLVEHAKSVKRDEKRRRSQDIMIYAVWTGVIGSVGFGVVWWLGKTFLGF